MEREFDAEGFPGRIGLDFAAEENCVAVSQQLLDLLVCPLCKTPVKMTTDEKGLKCGTCHRVYPGRDDIPVMLVDEARIESE
jgi:uncharacterized protein YbaR (Trm112 family)